MTTLTRYILRELLLPLFATIALVVIGAATTQLIRLANEVSALGMSLGDLLLALPYALPTFLGMGLPVAYFLSLLLAFGRMQEDRELIALAASGVSTARLLALPLALSVVLAAIGVVMTLWAEPYAIRRLRSVLVESAADYFGRTMTSGVIHDHLGDITIYFGGRDKETHEVYQVFIADERDHERPHVITAESGRIQRGETTRLQFQLHKGEMHEFSTQPDSKDTSRRISFDDAKLEIDTGGFVGRAVGNMPALNRLELSELITRMNDEKLSQDDRNVAVVTLHRKIAFPLANVLFVVIAFPMITWFTRLKSYLTSATLVAVYFTLAQGTDSLMQRFAMGPVTATWAPTVAFGAIGVALTAWRLRK